MRNKLIDGYLSYVEDSDNVSLDRLKIVRSYIEQLEAEQAELMSLMLRMSSVIKDFEGV